MTKWPATTMLYWMLSLTRMSSPWLSRLTGGSSWLRTPTVSLCDLSRSHDRLRLHHHGVFQSKSQPKEGSTEATLTPTIMQSVTRAIPLLLTFPAQRFWVDYDADADVLYISFQ